MKTPFVLQAGKVPAVILACLLFAACSTTQKSSTGSGVQDAAPISEAGKSQPGAADTASPGSSAAQSDDPVTSAGSQQGAVASKGDEEAARLKQQLADQEADINRMRDEQVNAQRLADEEAAKQRAAEAAAATQDQQGGTSAEATTGSAAAAAAAGTGAQARDDDASSPNDQPVAGQPLQRSIYFKYDDSTIGDEFDAVIIAHAAFLKANPDFKAEVQGNCDDRGSREYNLALGARRAEAVKRGLELAGADGSKIKTVSFGSEKPVAFGQDEESYKQNRRADILY